MRRITIGTQELDSEDVAREVESDIAFLSLKLAQLEQRPEKNEAALENFRHILESRQAILDWLRQEREPIPSLANSR
jgi:hypothetical protein